MSLSGCAAYVPNLESERTFSYAEVATQIECETYLAATKINIEEQLAKGHPDVDVGSQKHIDIAFDTYAMSISIKPSLSYDLGAGLGLSTKNSAVSKSFFQFALGGGASPGGAGYDALGTATANNEYTFPVQKLFGPDKSHRLGTKTYNVLSPNAYLSESCKPGGRAMYDVVQDVLLSHFEPDIPGQDLVRQTAVPNITDANGVFGIYDFLNRSFAVNKTLDVLPTTIGFSKEYKVKVNVGVTPGWYVATGNTSPAFGAARTVDNLISVAFAPDKDGKAKAPVIAAKNRKGRNALGTRSSPPAQGSRRTINGVSPETANTLSNSINSLQLQSIQNRLNQLLN